MPAAAGAVEGLGAFPRREGFGPLGSCLRVSTDQSPSPLQVTARFVCPQSEWPRESAGKPENN